MTSATFAMSGGPPGVDASTSWISRTIIGGCVKFVRRVRVLANIALVWWLFAVGKMVAVGSTDGQLPIVIDTGLLIVLAFWLQPKRLGRSRVKPLHG